MTVEFCVGKVLCVLLQTRCHEQQNEKMFMKLVYKKLLVFYFLRLQYS